MTRKVAEPRESDSSVTPVALGVAAGALGAVIGGNVGRTNGASAAGAAVGAVAGVLVGEMATSCALRATETPRLAGYLQEHLGTTITAYLSDAGETSVEGWVSGVAEPESVQTERLSHAWEAARYLVHAYGDETAQSWFLGTNDLLDLESPAWVLRHGKTAKDWEYVIPAAREAVENAR